VFGLLIITVMFVAPTGLAGLPGRVLGAVPRHLHRTAPLDRTPGAEPAFGAGPVPDAHPKSPAESASSATVTPADPEVADAEPVGAPPRTEKE
jgi:branched-chain amino acid transport system permease protein